MENKSVQLVTKGVIMSAAEKKAISGIESVMDIANNLTGFTFVCKMCKLIFSDGKEYCTADEFLAAIAICSDSPSRVDNVSVSAFLIPILGCKFALELKEILFPEK